MTDLRPIIPPGTPPASRRLLRLGVGVRVRRRILNSSFEDDVDSPRVAEMLAALRDAEIETRGFAKRAMVEATPYAWEVLGRWASTYSSRLPVGAGAEEELVATSLARLGRRIADELDRLAANPAYRGHAVMGVSPIIFPAFRLEDEDGQPVSDHLAPTPSKLMERTRWADGRVTPGLLWPYAARRGQQSVTVWLWEPELPAPTPHP